MKTILRNLPEYLSACKTVVVLVYSRFRFFAKARIGGKTSLQNRPEYLFNGRRMHKAAENKSERKKLRKKNQQQQQQRRDPARHETEFFSREFQKENFEIAGMCPATTVYVGDRRNRFSGNVFRSGCGRHGDDGRSVHGFTWGKRDGCWPDPRLAAGRQRVRLRGMSTVIDWSRVTGPRVKTVNEAHTGHGENGFAGWNAGKKKSINNTDYWFWHRRWRGGGGRRAPCARATAAVLCRSASLRRRRALLPQGWTRRRAYCPKNPTSLGSRLKITTTVPSPLAAFLFYFFIFIYLAIISRQSLHGIVHTHFELQSHTGCR